MEAFGFDWAGGADGSRCCYWCDVATLREEKVCVAVAACGTPVPGFTVFALMAAVDAHFEGVAFVERVRAAALSA